MLPWQERVAVTLDVDWAPDDVIDHAAGLLVERGVAATWFVTHASPALDRLREHPDLFELGIHPNFAADSTQGDTPEAVLDHCLALVPEARAMRTHRLLQSSPLLALVRARTPIAVDVSLFLPHARALEPVEYPLDGGTLVRVPYLWEDDAEMLRPEPAWDTAGVARAAQGLAVFDFHPIHVWRHPGARTAFAGLLEALDGARGRRVSELA